MARPLKRRPVSQSIQFMAGFVLPTVILLTLSDESKLGPFWGMMLALAFPVAVELYAVLSGRKTSWLSLFAIIGILLIGAISLLGLSEEWLGLRRAAIYAIGALFLVGVLRFRRNVIERGLEKIIDMGSVRAVAKKRRTERQLDRHIAKSVYGLVGLLTLLAVWNYVLTLIIITAPTGSSEFNTEYAKLRLLSLPCVTLPFLIGCSAVIYYLIGGIEKLTGIDTETLLNKKQ